MSRMILCPYGRAKQCPVLTYGMALPGNHYGAPFCDYSTVDNAEVCSQVLPAPYAPTRVLQCPGIDLQYGPTPFPVLT